jgi:serine O-acetyltransferase
MIEGRQEGLRMMIRRVFGAARLLPIYLIYLQSSKHAIINADIERWCLFAKVDDTGWRAFVALIRRFPEFRSLLIYRMPNARWFRLLMGPLSPALYISTPNIGPGLFLQHAFATIIYAKSIGKNCWINQQVTIGFTDNSSAPVIGNDVSIFAGAKVLGGILIGDNVVIGAGAVVTKDVPSGCVVVGNPAYIVKRNGVACREPLQRRARSR